MLLNLISLVTTFYDNVKRNCSIDDLNPLSQEWQADALPLRHEDVNRYIDWRPNLMTYETF